MKLRNDVHHLPHRIRPLDSARTLRLRLSLLGAALACLLAAAGCGSPAKTVLVQPPMPPGVSWGGPAARTAGAREASRLPLPSDSAVNHRVRLRVGMIWRVGTASFYGLHEQGNWTASGQRFNWHKMTAANRTLPFGTVLRVTDLATGESVKVRINDRGPFWPRRIIDLSAGAARRIGLYRQGLGTVRLRILKLPHPLPPGIYTVQVGWFTHDGPLRRCRRMMRRYNHQPVISFHSRDGRWLRYGNGVSLRYEAAARLVRRLRRRNYPAYMVRLN